MTSLSIWDAISTMSVSYHVCILTAGQLLAPCLCLFIVLQYYSMTIVSNLFASQYKLIIQSFKCDKFQ